MADLHHIFGPSSLYRRKACPGSARLEAIELKQGANGVEAIAVGDTHEGGKQSANAARGTRLHTAVYDDQELALLEPSDAEHVMSCRRALAAVSGGLPWQHNVRVVVKESPFSEAELLFGTLDAVKLFPDEGLAVITDWKFGYREVEPAWDNLQLAAYAVGVWQQYPEIHTVSGSIVQPTLRRDNWPVYTFTDLQSCLDEIQGIVHDCRLADAPLCPGSQCLYCSAGPRCPKTSAAVITVASTLPVEITVENAARIWDACEAAEGQLELLKQTMKEMALAAGGLPGIAVKQVAGRRLVQNIGSLAKEVSQYMSAYEVLGHCKVAISDFEAALRAKMVDKGKLPKEAQQEAKRIIAQFSIEDRPTYRVSRESSK